MKIDVAETAARLKVTPGRVRQLLKVNRIAGAELIGPKGRGVWQITVGEDGRPIVLAPPGRQKVNRT